MRRIIKAQSEKILFPCAFLLQKTEKVLEKQVRIIF